MAGAEAATSRNGTGVGVIVSTKGDEEITFVEEQAWRQAQVQQDLLAGDQLRTGALGALALLFADRTQIRVHRNSSLTVKDVGGRQSGVTTLRLDRGGTWSRAATGGSDVRVETPSATAAIRGTDWSLTVDDEGRSTLVVLDGEVELANPFGSVTVRRGEVATAEIGRAPSKTILVSPQDREQMQLNFSLQEALGFLRLTEGSFPQIHTRRAALQAVPPERRSAEDWLSLAEIAFDLVERAAATEALQAARAGGLGTPETRARADYVEGYLAAGSRDFAGGEALLARALPDLRGHREVVAALGRYVSLILTQRIDEAESYFAALPQRIRETADYELVRGILIAFSGDLAGALEIGHSVQGRFPADARFAYLEAMMALLLDRPAEMSAAAERGVRIDPEDPNTWLGLGNYRSYFAKDLEGSVEAYNRGLAIRPNDTSLLNEIGLVYVALGEERLAEEMFLKAIELIPTGPVPRTNYATLMLQQDRIALAAPEIAAAQELDPALDPLLARLGKMALQTDRTEEAIEYFLKATVVNPTLSEAALGLAFAYYHADELALAEQALENASRLDPNDPVPPLAGSVIAQDQAQADRAILLGREAIRRYRRLGGTGLAGLAATRGGSTNLGSAFENLDLSDWGRYYAELSFDPYTAESYFFRALSAMTLDQQQSSLYQGLLIEPLAAAARNRRIDLFRRPFDDFSIGGGIGLQGDAFVHREGGDAQGFRHEPFPFSYFANIETSTDNGDRENSGSESLSGLVLVGAQPTPFDKVTLSLQTGYTRSELAGPETRPAPDDDLRGRFATAGIGYTRDLGGRDLLMTRLTVRRSENSFRNDDPFGTTLNPLDYSLASQFGLQQTQELHRAGLYDPNIDPDNPIIVVGALGPALGFPQLADSTGGTFSLRPESAIDLDDEAVLIQARHLFELGSFDLSYGAEVMPYWRDLTVRRLQFQQTGVGMLTSDGFNSVPFAFGSPANVSGQAEQDALAAAAHVNGLWRISAPFWVEAGVFADYNDNDAGQEHTNLQPRAGVAWQINSANWLRAAVRTDVKTPLTPTLAPIATVGLLPSDGFLDEGGRARSYLARLDTEWSPRLFTAVQAEVKELRDISISIPQQNDIFLAAEGRIERFTVAANYWLGGGFGVFGTASLTDSENRSAGAARGRDLPLVPDRQAEAGITWVHPSQLRLQLSQAYVGPRAANLANTDDLGGYMTTNALVVWRPLAKRLELGLQLLNIFDRDVDFAEDTPAPGRTVLVTGRVRF